ncbi:uncharacterized protein PAC_18211 [Phialocephala subalpina]|uniref:Uncharacterized protein n=1 Tax=Phialocephala subalpina TaxID=576137 RepID=A0A1L7XTE1_9HELO|nr:uncharacterized protein PAC_18211 [Phialocephala subalpina]
MKRSWSERKPNLQRNKQGNLLNSSNKKSLKTPSNSTIYLSNSQTPPIRADKRNDRHSATPDPTSDEVERPNERSYRVNTKGRSRSKPATDQFTCPREIIHLIHPYIDSQANLKPDYNPSPAKVKAAYKFEFSTKKIKERASLVKELLEIIGDWEMDAYMIRQFAGKWTARKKSKDEDAVDLVDEEDLGKGNGIEMEYDDEKESVLVIRGGREGC